MLLYEALVDELTLVDELSLLDEELLDDDELLLDDDEDFLHPQPHLPSIHLKRALLTGRFLRAL